MIAPTNGSTTNDTTPTLSGSCTTGDGNVSVVVKQGATTVQTLTPTCTTGTWTTTATALAQNAYTVTGSQTDAAGNTGTSAANTFTIDTTAPVVSVTKVNNATVTFPFLTNANVTSVGGACGVLTGDAATVSVSITGIAAQSGTAPCIAGAWTYTTSPALSASGGYTLTATQTDAAGNSGTSGGKTLTIDQVAPVVSVIAPASGSATNDTTPALSGSCTTGDGNVSVVVKQGATTLQTLTPTCTTGTWTTTATALAQNAYTVTGSQTDAAGNTGTSAANSFTIDTTPPVVTVTAPTAGLVTNNTAPTFVGTCTTGDGTVTATVKVGATTSQTRTSACIAGAWSVAASPTLAQNAYTVQATQTDAAGNTGSSATVTFTIDTTAPVVTVTAPASGSATNDTTPALTGGCTTGDGNVTVVVKQGAATLQTFTPACSAGSWSATATALAENGYTVQASQTDAAGNTGASAASSFTIDTTAPTVTVTAPTAALVTNNATLTFGGGCTNGDGTVTATVKLGAAVSQTRTSACTAGAWSVAASPTLAQNTYTVQASQTDGAGNTGSSATVTFTIDTTAPGVTITRVNGGTVTFPFLTIANVTSIGGACGTAAGDVATVNVSITGAATQSGTAPCTAGTWTYTTSPTLATQGSYSVSATQADTAGNTGTSGAKTFKIVPPIVHVSTPGNGGSATGDGSATAPVDTVSGAITLAQSYGFNQIRISQGTFSEGTTGVSLVTNFAISGGWNVGFTAQSGINTSTVIQGGQQAVLADGVTGVTLSQLMLSGMGASAVDRSVYGLRAINGASVSLANVRVTAATGFVGTSGSVGTTGAIGANGANATAQAGAAGASSPATSTGGAGGNKGVNGSAGQAGSGGADRGSRRKPLRWWRRLLHERRVLPAELVATAGTARWRVLVARRVLVA